MTILPVCLDTVEAWHDITSRLSDGRHPAQRDPVCTSASDTLEYDVKTMCGT